MKNVLEIALPWQLLKVLDDQRLFEIGLYIMIPNSQSFIVLDITPLQTKTGLTGSLTEIFYV